MTVPGAYKLGVGQADEEQVNVATSIEHVDLKRPDDNAPLRSVPRLLLSALPRASWAAFIGLIIVWVMLVEGGLGFKAAAGVGSACVFGWHAVLMSAAFGEYRSSVIWRTGGMCGIGPGCSGWVCG